MTNPMNKLAYRLIAYVAIAFAVGAGVFFGAKTLANWGISSIIDTPAAQEQRLARAADSLQDYIDEHDVSRSDKAALDDWVSRERYVMLQVYGDDRILYDSTMDENLASLDIPGGDSMQWQKTFDVRFSDGEGEAMFYEYYAMGDELAATAASGALATAAFALVLVLLVFRKTRSIGTLNDEVHILEGGDLDYPISVQGDDELGELARSIDDMRKAVLARQTDEDAARRRDYELIASMSHDLRSPLTSLIGYLDILAMGRCTSEQDEKRYLESSRQKAYRVKEISDELFERFLSHDADSSTRSLTECDCRSLIGARIEEGVFELRSIGMEVQVNGMECLEGLSVQADLRAIARAFDNLFGNIRNHGVARGTVRIVCSRAEDGACGMRAATITLVNSVRDGGSSTHEGAGLGLRVATRIFAHAGWRLSVSQVDRTFEARIDFDARERV